MRTLLLALLLAAVGTSYSQKLIPQVPLISLSHPPAPANETVATIVMLCGVADMNVTEFNSSWITPAGETIVLANRDRFRVQNYPLAVLSFHYVTTLTVSRLSHADAGTYTCSASYVVNDDYSNVMTGSNTIELQLSVSVTPIVNPVHAMAGAKGALNCEMTRYIRPDSTFLWRRLDEVFESSGRFEITYNTLADGRAQNGGDSLTFSRISSLQITSLDESDSGTYTCFVSGTDVSADVELVVEANVIDTTPDGSLPITTSTAISNTERTDQPQGSSFPIPAVGAIAGFLGLVVVVLILLILLVSCHKRRKSSTVVLDPPRDRDLNENTAYESSSSSSNHVMAGGNMQSRPLPKYAIVDKRSMSPPPPLPARPSTNLSMCAGNNSANSASDLDRTPPGYDTPGHINSMNTDKNHSITIDPYYDNPDDVRSHHLTSHPKKKTSYYDEVDLEKKSTMNHQRPEGPCGISTVPSPAAVLSGSLKHNLGHPTSPDFTYPPFSNEAQNEREHDYDQIYSEPLDPTIIRQDFEFENEDVPIPYSAIYDDPQPFQDACVPLRITQKNIIEIKQLGMGQFGHVILAKTVSLSMKDLKVSDTDTDHNKSIFVAIKKLRTDADGCLMEAFDKEVKFMARLNHDNVIRLLGVCTTGESFIMMEYMENGDLNQFLTKQMLMPDTIAGLQENEVTPIILLYIGVQIASGLHYLSSQRFVHRDLATRNCLVGRDFIVKISDFGMSRSLYESAYYRVQGTLVLPIRWMACETFYGKFSVKSDAWAFGVTLWEIYTLGKVDPYDSMTDEEVIADAIRGQDRLILKKPPSCPQDVYDIMQRCWVHEPSMRADFGEIYSRLFIIYTRQAL